jgi:Dof zinc finger protein DOF5.5
MVKHCSEESETVAGTNGRLFTPKTLSIHDPEEAARSSIWSALGLDNRLDFPVSAAGIFNGLPLKAGHVAETEELPLQTLHANPAATSRSTTYHENN